MLDVYTLGSVERISPEAPVPVLRVSSENRRPGGAGNAVLNLLSLGMEVRALGRVGNDEAGHQFLEGMAAENVETQGIFQDPATQTPQKNRMIASGQQIVRIDHETFTPLSKELEEKVVKALPSLLKDVDAVAISDYAKGFLTPSLLREIIRLAREKKIPLIVDPKGRDFTRYRGATLLKPNLHEAIAAAGLGMEASLHDVAQEILREVAAEYLMITRSSEGISLFDHSCNESHFPAQVHEVKDVTGAGDTVLAVITAALANNLPLEEAAHLANRAAALVIEHIGCARVTLTDLSPSSSPT